MTNKRGTVNRRVLDGVKHRNEIRRIHWEKRPIKHTPSFQFEFVSIVGSKSIALCFRFYGAQVRLDLNFQAHNQNPVAYATSQSLTLSPEVSNSLRAIRCNENVCCKKHIEVLYGGVFVIKGLVSSEFTNFFLFYHKQLAVKLSVFLYDSGVETV